MNFAHFWRPPIAKANLFETKFPYLQLNINRPNIRETAVVLRSSVLFLLPSLPLSSFLAVMDQNLGNGDLSKNNDNSKAPVKLMKIGEGKRSNKCSQCDYVTSWTANLRKHLKTHSREKSNKCNQCDYASSNPSTLRVHLKMHTGEKSNKCIHCDYESSRAGHLRRHLKTHSGEKLNNCDQCDYASFYASDLRTHLKTHSGEKTNNCNQRFFKQVVRLI